MRNLSRIGQLCVLLFILLLTISLPARSLAMEELKVGYVPGTGFLEEDRPGHLRGNGYEYMECLSGFLGAHFVYVPCVNWWEAGAKLEKGEIDMLPSMPGDYRTLPFAKRTDHVIARFPMELVVQDDFAGGHIRIGTLDYNYPIPHLPDVAKQHGFTYELVTFSDPADMKKAFAARAITGCVQPLLHPGKKERVLALFDRVSYRLLLHQDRQELYNRVNAAMDELLLNQPNIRNRLNDKYERSKGFPLVLSPEEIAYLQQKKVFKVAVMLKNKPYFYKDADGNWAGATKALLEQLENDLQVKIELVEENSLEGIRRLLTRGAVDFVADVPCDFSWLDNLFLTPTQSYLDVGYVPVVRRSARLGEQPKVAAMAGRWETVTFIMNKTLEDNIVYCASPSDCFKAVSSGLADIAYTPRATIPYITEDAAAYNLDADTENAFHVSLSLGVSQSADPRLWQILNKEINHLPPNLLTDAVNHVAHENVRHLAPSWLLYHYPLQAALLIFLTMGTIMGIIYYRSRTHRQKLASIRHMAYTDMRHQLPNMLYLEQELPALLAREQALHPADSCYVTVFDFGASPFARESTSRHALDRQVRDTVLHLKEKYWVLECVIGASPLQIVSLCRAASPDEIVSLTAEAIAEAGCLQEHTARVYLDLKAGICPLKDTPLPVAEENADIACREIMHTKLQVKLYDQKLAETLAAEEKLLLDLQQALEKRDFTLYYKPRFTLPDNDFSGAEAVIYWQHQELAAQLSARTMSALDLQGTSSALDMFLLEEVMLLQKKRYMKGYKLMPLAVRQAPACLADEDYLASLKELMEKYDLPRGSVELEFAATALSGQQAQPESLLYVLMSLKEMGYGLILDGFGAGNADFALLSLPVDKVKISPMLLQEAMTTLKTTLILRQAIMLCAELKLTVICAGLDTPQQEKLLLRFKCPQAQGSLKSPPLPEKDMLALMAP